ncbi:MAG TPA: AI-2E family transporter [Candidatus Paceibacterota bacterium]|nr:AI-2E family transporter [Candidatus Paceibacterota bacterium]
MQTKVIEKYFFYGLLLATFIFAFFIFRPFWTVLVLGISFSIVLYPIYEWLQKRYLPNWLSALITLILFIVVLCGPLFSVGALVFSQSQDVYTLVTDNRINKPFINSIETKINNILPKGIVFDVDQKITEFVSYISNNIANIFTATVSAFFSFVLMLLIIFYSLKDGAQWRKAIIVLSPLGDQDDEKIITRLTQTVNGVIKGFLLISLIQGTVLGLGLTIFGIPNAALWGVVAAITSLIPALGTSLVSVPAIIFLFATGQTASAVGLVIWVAFMIVLIDNFLGPIIVGKRINISSLLILFSVLGGIALVGPVGILIGPLTVSFLYTLISIYRNEFKQNIQNTFT